MAACGPALRRFEYTHPAMGTTFRVVLYAPDAARADPAAEAAFARLAELEGRLSDWDPESELSRLCAVSSRRAPTGPLAVSTDLVTVLDHALRISAASGGAFDVTVGPYVRLWRRSARQGELPDRAHLERARSAVGWTKVRVEPRRRTVELLAPDMALDLGGIAKGYALDQCLATLASHGVRRALVDGGGDLAAGDPPPGRGGWRVAVAVARSELDAPPLWVELARGAVATSGDLFRSLEIDGVTYSHLVDPRTGLGLTSRVAATVLAPSGMAADALASAACILGAEAGLALIERTPLAEGRLASSEKGASGACQSSGFPGKMLR